MNLHVRVTLYISTQLTFLMPVLCVASVELHVFDYDNMFVNYVIFTDTSIAVVHVIHL